MKEVGPSSKKGENMIKKGGEKHQSKRTRRRVGETSMGKVKGSGSSLFPEKTGRGKGEGVAIKKKRETRPNQVDRGTFPDMTWQETRQKKKHLTDAACQRYRQVRHEYHWARADLKVCLPSGAR